MKKEILNLEECFLDEIEIIEQESFKDPWSKNAYLEEITNPVANYKVITLDGMCVAYGGYWKILDEAHITNVCVKKEFRQKGYGKMLMDALMLDAKSQGVRAMTLEVRVSNLGAIKLYETCGFKSVGVRKKYYADNEDALIMWLEEL